MSDAPVRDKNGNLVDMYEMHGLKRPDLHESSEPSTRIGGFIAGLRNAIAAGERGEDYQPTSRIGRFVQAFMNLGGNDVDYSQYSTQQMHQQLAAHSAGNPEQSKPVAAPVMQPNPEATRNTLAFNTADEAVAALASGSTSRDDIRALEQATIENLNLMKERGGEAKQLDRALGVMNADGNVTGNEYKVFQAIIEKSGVDLSGVGVSNAKDIDTTQELGKALAAMQQQRGSNETQVG